MRMKRWPTLNLRDVTYTVAEAVEMDLLDSERPDRRTLASAAMMGRLIDRLVLLGHLDGDDLNVIVLGFEALFEDEL